MLGRCMQGSPGHTPTVRFPGPGVGHVVFDNKIVHLAAVGLIDDVVPKILPCVAETKI